MDEKYLGNIGALLLILILAIICLPVLTGMLIALLMGAVDLAYFSIVIIVSCIIWSLLYLMWWI